MVHAGGDDSPSVSPGMVCFAASLVAESVVDVEGVVATPRAPVLRATARHVEVRVRMIRCVARPASPVKRPLIREDLKVIQYQSQEADTLLLH